MKKTKAHLNALIASLLAMVVILEIGYISLNHPLRTDWSKRRLYELAPRTKEIVSTLNQDIKITVLFQEQHPLYYDVENLLEEYRSLSPRHIEVTKIDPIRDAGAMEQLKLKYDLANENGAVETPLVVFALDDERESNNRRIVRLIDMVELEMEEGRKQPVMKAFKGEEAFTRALYGLIHGENPKVYFLAGHGELSLSDTSEIGASKIRTMAARNNLDLFELYLEPNSEIPKNAAALVVAGPLKALAPYEVDLIERYLERGGRLMLLLDPFYSTGLNSMLERWKILIRDDIVVDPASNPKRLDCVITQPDFSNPKHSITQTLHTKGQNLLFYMPRSIQFKVTDDSSVNLQQIKHIDWLLVTSEQSYCKTDPSDLARTGDDVQGMQCLGAVVTRGGSGVGYLSESKMVVIGDSSFIGNNLLSGGNPDFFLESLNWLIDREITLASKPLEEIHLALSSKQISKLFWFNVVGIPCVAAVVGLFIWYRRRK